MGPSASCGQIPIGQDGRQLSVSQGRDYDDGAKEVCFIYEILKGRWFRNDLTLNQTLYPLLIFLGLTFFGEVTLFLDFPLNK